MCLPRLVSDRESDRADVSSGLGPARCQRDPAVGGGGQADAAVQPRVASESPPPPGRGPLLLRRPRYTAGPVSLRRASGRTAGSPLAFRMSGCEGGCSMVGRIVAVASRHRAEPAVTDRPLCGTNRRHPPRCAPPRHHPAARRARWSIENRGSLAAVHSSWWKGTQRWTSALSAGAGWKYRRSGWAAWGSVMVWARRWIGRKESR